MGGVGIASLLDWDTFFKIDHCWNQSVVRSSRACFIFRVILRLHLILKALLADDQLGVLL